MPHKLIGILAGMGPRSTAPFVDMVVDECQRQYGATDDVDFPPMMIYSLPTPFYVDRPLDHAAMEATICDGLRKLERTGVQLIAMPCNSAHIYYDWLAACVHVPLLNMVELALQAIPAISQRVALLATRVTAMSNLYQSALEAAGHAVLYDEALQQRVDELLLAVKSSLDRQAAAGLWADLITGLRDRGASMALLACTDLNVISMSPAPALAVVDATRELAVATVRSWRALA